MGVTVGTDKVDLSKGGADADSITLTDDNTITVKCAGASIIRGDVTIKLTYNGSEVCQYKITVYTPKEEVETSVTDHPFTYQGYTNGYESRHHFKINDQFDDLLPADIELNEKWTENAQNDHTPATTWPQANENSWTVNPAGDIDFLTSCAWEDDIPNTLNPQTPLGAVKVYHWNGEHYVGSLIKGDGVKVLTKKWQYYQDHGRRE